MPRVKCPRCDGRKQVQDLPALSNMLTAKPDDLIHYTMIDCPSCGGDGYKWQDPAKVS